MHGQAARLSGHYIRKRLRTPDWARWIASFSGLLLVAAILVYRLGGIDFEALKTLFLVVIGLVVLALLIAMAALARVWRRGYEGGGQAIAAFFIALLVAAPFLLAGLMAFRYPQVATAETAGMLAADIVGGSTLTEALADGTTTSVGDTAATINGRRFQARAAQVYTQARKIFDVEGWAITDVATSAPEEEVPETGDLGVSGTIAIPLPTARASVEVAAAEDPLDRSDSGSYTVKAVARGPILALSSDVTLHIVEDGNETFVDMRSTSRDVAWDLGQNRRFIEDFLTRLDEAMAGVAAMVPAETG